MIELLGAGLAILVFSCLAGLAVARFMRVGKGPDQY